MRTPSHIGAPVSEPTFYIHLSVPPKRMTPEQTWLTTNMPDNSDNLRVERFAPHLRGDFYQLHQTHEGGGWCFCAAWWTPTWDGWGEQSADQNRALREDLLAAGEYDGYLAYLADVPVGWCQVGRRDRLQKLVRQFQLAPDAHTWAITCFVIAPAHRRQGLATCMLAAILADLSLRGIRRVEAFPKRGETLDLDDLWNGPEAMFRAAGFSVWRDHPTRPVLALEL